MEQYKIEMIKEDYGKVKVEDISNRIGESKSAIYSVAFELRKKGENISSNLQHSKESYEKSKPLRSKRLKEKWKDPEYLKKMEERDKINSDLMKKQNPMFNKEISLKAHEKIREKWQDPKVKAKVLGQNHWNWKNGVSRLYSQRLKKENFVYSCSSCGQMVNIDIHHKDLNERNNVLSNLLPLCRSCHTKLHRLIEKNGS
jgi:hypothetical protein